MGRFFGSLLFVSLTAMVAGACGDSSASGPGTIRCSSYTTCASCTPVNGCGWCFNASGGACASDPDQCANVSEFTWTWEVSGCPDLDASVSDAAIPLPDTSAPSNDSGSHPVDAGTGAPKDAASDVASEGSAEASAEASIEASTEAATEASTADASGN